MIKLADTATLLVSGGDSRITPDAVTGRNQYACLATPDHGVIALGSSTASSISEKGMQAARALLQICEAELATKPEALVYREQMDRLRTELLHLCAPDSAAEVIVAASGTDMHLLLAQLLQMPLTLMIDPAETGSGLAAALRGKHFSKDSTCIGGAPGDGHISEWQGELQTFAIRDYTGNPVPAAQLKSDFLNAANNALAAGKQILCILTDVSKTGMIFPDIGTLCDLQKRWPQQIHVLVDACQFRLSKASLQAYLAHGFMIALTGSKFLTGPTFSGALLLPANKAAQLRTRCLPVGTQAYSVAGDWPASFAASTCLPQQANFGLLLRWEAALAELRDFMALPEKHIQHFLSGFKQAVVTQLDADPHFCRLPNPDLDRRDLLKESSWDHEQSIFPFVLYHHTEAEPRRPLSRSETMQMYRSLQSSTAKHRYQLGQPVLCGERDGMPVSALRICVSAPMLVDALNPAKAQQWISDALDALKQLAILIDTQCR